MKLARQTESRTLPDHRKKTGWTLPAQMIVIFVGRLTLCSEGEVSTACRQVIRAKPPEIADLCSLPCAIAAQFCCQQFGCSRCRGLCGSSIE